VKAVVVTLSGCRGGGGGGGLGGVDGLRQGLSVPVV